MTAATLGATSNKPPLKNPAAVQKHATLAPKLHPASTSGLKSAMTAAWWLTASDTNHRRALESRLLTSLSISHSSTLQAGSQIWLWALNCSQCSANHVASTTNDTADVHSTTRRMRVCGFCGDTSGSGSHWAQQRETGGE